MNSQRLGTQRGRELLSVGLHVEVEAEASEMVLCKHTEPNVRVKPKPGRNSLSSSTFARMC